MRGRNRLRFFMLELGYMRILFFEREILNDNVSGLQDVAAITAKHHRDHDEKEQTIFHKLLYLGKFTAM